MFRCCVSLLVIVGFLASQLAGFPHAHGVTSALEQKAHDATPHFHFTRFSPTDHEHAHDHQHSGHRHEHDSNSESEGRKPVDCGLAGLDHDADAIFVLGSCPTVLRTNLGDHATSAWQLALLAQVPKSLGDLPTNSMDSPRWHPPDEVLDGSGIYLTLRNLRI